MTDHGEPTCETCGGVWYNHRATTDDLTRLLCRNTAAQVLCARLSAVESENGELQYRVKQNGKQFAHLATLRRKDMDELAALRGRVAQGEREATGLLAMAVLSAGGEIRITKTVLLADWRIDRTTDVESGDLILRAYAADAARGGKK